jgi:hypothetical protein
MLFYFCNNDRFHTSYLLKKGKTPPYPFCHKNVPIMFSDFYAARNIELELKKILIHIFIEKVKNQKKNDVN